MRLIHTLIFTLLTISCFAQIKFEEGYFIDKKGDTTFCEIRNVDWRYNPHEFKYRLNTTGEIAKADTSNVTEWGFPGRLKYIKRTIQIDETGGHLRDAAESRNPIFNTQQLFLKVIVEGSATLYFHESPTRYLFFYSLEEGPILQLNYKWYETNNSTIIQDYGYRQQLQNYLSCDKITQSDIDGLNYQEADLIQYFEKYNDCQNEAYVLYQPVRKRRDKFNFYVSAGAKYLSIDFFRDGVFPVKYDFGSQFSFRPGIEMEYILPFNKNKWILFVEGNYEYFREQIDTNFVYNIDYKSIEVPFGLRHYFYLDDHKSFFLNASVSANFDFDSNFFINKFPIANVNFSSNLSFGGGFSWNRYKVEFRYNQPRDIITFSRDYYSSLESTSLFVSYRL